MGTIYCIVLHCYELTVIKYRVCLNLIIDFLPEKVYSGNRLIQSHLNVEIEGLSIKNDEEQN